MRDSHVEYTDAQYAKLSIPNRIDAVFGDGMFYTVDKAAKYALCADEDVQNWIAAMPGLARLRNEETGVYSYRIPGFLLESHWAKYGWSGTKELVPGIYPPRVINGKTECDVLAEAPLRKLAKASFLGDRVFAVELAAKVEGYGWVVEEELGRWSVYGPSAPTLNRLLAGYPGISIRRMTRRRELNDIDPVWLNLAMPFYLGFIRKHLDAKSKMTLERYCPDEEEQEHYFLRWFIRAIEKLDESKGVPLGGYLASVLPKWVHDVAQEKMGRKNVSLFRAYDKLVETGGSEDSIAAQLGVDKDELSAIRAQENQFYQIRSPESIFWDDDQAERTHDAVFVQAEQVINTETSLAILRAAQEFEDPSIVTELLCAIDQGRMANVSAHVKRAVIRHMRAVV